MVVNWSGAPVGQRAVVVGGGIAGLTAARVLADSFAQVTVVERDRFATNTVPRAGAPQSRQAHLLDREGDRLLEQFFPGLRAAVQAAGGVPVGAGVAAWPDGLESPGGPLAAPPLLSCTRPLLESQIYAHVVAHPRIALWAAGEVTGLVLRKDSAVAGVRIGRPGRPTPDGLAEILPADLVVDAAGQGSCAPEWLAALGFPVPRETVVPTGLRYASALVAPSRAGRDPGAVLPRAAGTPGAPRTGLLLPVEGRRWMVCLIGRDGDAPPTDAFAFRAFARSLANPLLGAALEDADLLGPIYACRVPANRVRHFEALAERPDGFLVLGDAACTFSPAIVPGMAMAVASAQLLGECLTAQRALHPDGGLQGLARTFPRRLAGACTQSWHAATGTALARPGVTAPLPGLATWPVGGRAMMGATLPSRGGALAPPLYPRS